MSKLLEMKNVTKIFPGVKALDNVTLDLEPGEILGIVGENGAGKSTLMKVLSGSYPDQEYEGEIFIDGKQMSFKGVADAKAAGIEMIYQEVNALLDSSIAENIFVNNLPGKGLLVDYNTLYADTKKLLDQIGIDYDPKTIVRKLNSGQLQMLAIARGIASNPRILVFDEPTTALTDKEVDILMSFMRGLKKKGVSCIIISHKLEEIFQICDRVTVIRDGQSIRTKRIEEWDKSSMITDMIGRPLSNMYAKTAHAIGDVVLEVKDMVVPHPTLRNRNIVDHVSFQLRQGEILGIGGLVGAGRSELLEGIFAKQTEGVSKTILVNGRKVNIAHSRDAIDNGLGFVTEERKLTGFVDTMNIQENISLASLDDLPGLFFINKKAEDKLTQQQFELMKVKAPSKKSMVVNLSGGNQQKVVLAKWLMKNPRILLIDEPTKGIDVGAKAEFYRVLDTLANDGYSIVLVSSDMPELVSMSDRVLVMCEGKITGELTSDHISQENVMHAAIGHVS